ncbi:hypothetical protein G9A89_004991 [Geosiphon pyriformis]|nr:hypothetical protein G9A89_004991 [Geosiphon pyriformis]
MRRDHHLCNPFHSHIVGRRILEKIGHERSSESFVRSFVQGVQLKEKLSIGRAGSTARDRCEKRYAWDTTA